MLLVVRVLLFLAFAINALGDPKINLLITATMVISLLTLNVHLGYAYKTRLLNLIESSFIINLGVLSLWLSFIAKDSTKSAESQLIVTSDGWLSFCEIYADLLLSRLSSSETQRNALVFKVQL